MFRQVSTSHELMNIIQTTMKQRAEIVTNIHSHSSRSHLVISITVVSTYVNSVSSTPLMSPQGSPYKCSSSITVQVNYCLLPVDHLIMLYFIYTPVRATITLYNSYREIC